jgi:ribosomal protein L11 methyltransferase
MPLFQLRLQTTSNHAEAISLWLNLFDALAVTFEDAADEPVLEPMPGTTPIWAQTQVVCLLEETSNINKIIAFLRNQLGEDVIQSYTVEALNEQNWERAWLKDFHPMRFGKRLWICPSVFTPPEPDAVNIILDPGLAFGTGTHPTTALCLEWLDAHPPENKIVIDYGCGSGILAIAAVKLGAKAVYAIDYDEQALLATRENAARNGILENVIKTLLPEAFPKIQADILMANILTNPLIELAPHFAQHSKPTGQLVLSGILADQVDSIMQAYQPFFAITEITQKEDWIRISGLRVASA